MEKRHFLFIICLLFISGLSKAQDNSEKETTKKGGVVFSLNEDGSRYVKLSGLGQIWLRNTQMNPGTTINGYETDSYSDISIRRLRFQIFAQVSDKVFFYTQFGQNNFNFHSPKYDGAFFHDALVEYAVDKEKLSFGAGLTGWSGLNRYASPSTGSILTLDAPLYQQATNGVNDQFLRKLSVYAKGQLGKLDYRIAITQPMTVSGAPEEPTGTDFSFSNEPAKKQAQGYFKYMFMDKESNLTPYETGTYLGKKSVFNIGGGFIYQQDAMWALNNNADIVNEDIVLFGLDVFYDRPLTDETALTAYAAYTNYDFGNGYVRNVGVNNAATGANGATVGGYGGAFPMVGTGNTIYAQAGYLFGKNILSEGGKLQPFAALQYSDYDYLDDSMVMYELGANYLIHGGHGSKLSFMYQSRPTYENDGGENVIDTRKGMAVLQYQVSF